MPGNYPPSMESAYAHKNPAQVMIPAQSCVPSNASGIIVSASIARIPPAAKAVVADWIATETPPSRLYPANPPQHPACNQTGIYTSPLIFLY